MANAKVVGCCSCCILLVLAIILPLSFDSIDPLHYGLKYNTITKNMVSDTVFHGGLYFTGPFGSFIRFPNTLVTSHFGTGSNSNGPRISTRTKEGLPLSLDISFQYRLDVTRLAALYRQFNLDYEATFERIAREQILRSAGEYEAPIYWQDRRSIGAEMQRLIKSGLEGVFADVQLLQLLEIVLPEQYEDSIVMTQVEAQNVRQQQFEQEAQQITSYTTTLMTEANANVTVVEQTAQADAILMKQTATSEANSVTVHAESNAYKETMKQLNINPPDLAEYIWLHQINDMDSATVLTDVKNSIVQVPTKNMHHSEL
jgi:hypothetical protein